MKHGFRRFGRALLVVMDALWVLFILAVCAAWWTGLIAKDTDPRWMPFYFIPHTLIAAVCGLWLFFTLSHRFRIVQVGVFITIAACFIKLLAVDTHWKAAPPSLPPDNIRILHCNTAQGMLGVESLAAELAESEPDIIVITEPPSLHNIADVAYHALGMPHVLTSHGLTIASHHPLTFVEERLVTSANGLCARVDTDQGSFLLFAAHVTIEPEGHYSEQVNSPVEWIKALFMRIAANIDAAIHTDRSAPLRELATWARDNTNKLPKVVIGDLATPHDATALDPLRKFMRHAYRENGRGWPYTWPVQAPTYAVDQTWVSFDTQVNDFHLQKPRLSDHKRQVADISLKTKTYLTPETEESP